MFSASLMQHSCAAYYAVVVHEIIFSVNYNSCFQRKNMMTNDWLMVLATMRTLIRISFITSCNWVEWSFALHSELCLAVYILVYKVLSSYFVLLRTFLRKLFVVSSLTWYFAFFLFKAFFILLLKQSIKFHINNFLVSFASWYAYTLFYA